MSKNEINRLQLALTGSGAMILLTVAKSTLFGVRLEVRSADVGIGFLHEVTSSDVLALFITRSGS
jgi:ethanolamine utilization microcompartment shell protein EutS